MESDVITMQDIFEFKIDSFAPDGTINGALRPTGLRPSSWTSSQSAASSCPPGCSRRAPSRRTSRTSVGDPHRPLIRPRAPRARRRGDDRGAAGRCRRQRYPGRRGGEPALPGSLLRPDAPQAGEARAHGGERRRHGERQTRQGPLRALLGVGRGHRDGAPDRRLQQHEGVDQGSHAGGARLRGAEPRPAALGRVLQLEADRRPAADHQPQADPGGPREGAEARRGDAALRRAHGGGRAGARLRARRGARGRPLRRRRRRQRHHPDAAISQLQSEKIRVFTVGIESPDSRPRISRSSRRAPAAPTPPPARPRR